MSEFFVKLDDEKAKLPVRASPLAAGYDLYSIEEKVIQPGERALIDTGLIMMVPEGTYGRIAPRSGLAWKHGLDVGAGVIDRDYRGRVKVLLFHLGKDPVKLEAGERIAQLVLERIVSPPVTQTDDFGPIGAAGTGVLCNRGTGGFGSTGQM